MIDGVNCHVIIQIIFSLELKVSIEDKNGTIIIPYDGLQPTTDTDINKKIPVSYLKNISHCIGAADCIWVMSSKKSINDMINYFICKLRNEVIFVWIGTRSDSVLEHKATSFLSVGLRYPPI